MVLGGADTMKSSSRFIVGLALASFVYAAPGAAQDSGSMTVGNATVSVGGGTAILTLPDVEFTKQYNNAVAPAPFVTRSKDSEDFDDEIGWNVNASIEAPMGPGRSVSVNGFWANIDDNDTLTCTTAAATATCGWANIIDRPGVADAPILAGVGQSALISSERDVDQWGASLEVKKMLNPGVMGVTKAPPQRYLAVGADIRGIDQELSLNANGAVGATPITTTYNEDLDTTYYGAYLAWGGGYNPFLFRGLWERLGLQSSFRLQGGVYSADTDYDGRFAAPLLGATGQLSLSSDDVAFIGGLTTETSKKIGRRAKLSLTSTYEYYSWVPDMRYNDVDAGFATGPNVGTTIGDDDAFSMRTSLRLTVKLGPSELYQEPMK